VTARNERHRQRGKKTGPFPSGKSGQPPSSKRRKKSHLKGKGGREGDAPPRTKGRFFKEKGKTDENLGEKKRLRMKEGGCEASYGKGKKKTV